MAYLAARTLTSELARWPTNWPPVRTTWYCARLSGRCRRGSWAICASAAPHSEAERPRVLSSGVAGTSMPAPGARVRSRSRRGAPGASFAAALGRARTSACVMASIRDASSSRRTSRLTVISERGTASGHSPRKGRASIAALAVSGACDVGPFAPSLAPRTGLDDPLRRGGSASESEVSAELPGSSVQSAGRLARFIRDSSARWAAFPRTADVSVCQTGAVGDRGDRW